MWIIMRYSKIAEAVMGSGLLGFFLLSVCSLTLILAIGTASGGEATVENRQDQPFGEIRIPKGDRGESFILSVEDVKGEVKYGSLRVETQPSGADLELKGEMLGKAPLYLEKLKPGPMRLSVSLKSYETKEIQVLIRAGKEIHLTLVLEPLQKTQSLTVNSNPPGAYWLLGGSYAGQTPDKISLGKGTYSVTLRLKGYKDWVGRVSVNYDEEAVVSAELEPIDSKPLQMWRDSVTGMEFVWVPGGCFNMGSPPGEKGRHSDEEPVHEVCLDGFWIGKFEVTNEQFRLFRPKHDSRSFDKYFFNGERQPVVFVSWEDAKAFTEWLMKENNNEFEFRLPTEAEWEYACRSGTTTSRFWGEDPADASFYSNVVVDKSDWGHELEALLVEFAKKYELTVPVGSFAPNDFGLYDMLGNVWEWCEDIYAEDAYQKHRRNNPLYKKEGSGRVLRGGGWITPSEEVRCANRDSDSPSLMVNNTGFRVIRRVRGNAVNLSP